MLNYGAKTRDLELPVINSIMRSNYDQIARTTDVIMESGHRDVGFVGLTFKESTDDLRESPPVMMAETLIGKGFQLKIFDPEVELTRLTGANKEFLEEKLPHINSQLVRTMEELVTESKTLVVCKDPGDASELMKLVTPSHKIIDLGGWLRDESFPPGCYYGLYW
jgi:GDP-mannose 6-dehydrogenase